MPATDEDFDTAPATDDAPVERSESGEGLAVSADETVDEYKEHDEQIEIVAVTPADETAGSTEATEPAAHVVAFTSFPEQADEQMDETHDESAEVVPFYKRELSFRRKSAAPAAVVVPLVAQDDDRTEAANPEVHAREADDSAVAWGSPSTWSSEARQPAAEVVSEEPAEEVEPVEQDAAVEVVAEEPANEFGDLEPESDENPEPVAEASAPDDSTRELAATEKAVADDDLAASGPEPADDVETTDADESSPVPFGALGAEADDANFAEDGDTAANDSASSKSRFARKSKNGTTEPKRKPSRGGKGGKGRRVVGLKIGASQIAAAVITETDGGHELGELARRPLAAGIVVDGEVRDVDALANAVKAFFDEEKLPKKDVRIGLASNRIGVRTFDIIGIDDEARFDNAVRFRAHEVLPVAAHESVLDYRVLEERPNEAGELMRRVLLVVAPRSQVLPYTEVASRAGLKLSGIDLEALGLLRAFVAPKPFAVRAADDTATVIVSIGHESSTLVVAGAGACEFTRVFGWGGGELEEAIASALEVHPAEATTILRHLSLSGPGRQFDGLDEATRAKAVDAVRGRLTPFARELVSSLQFYQTQDESLGIGGIVITGGTSHLEGLGEALHQMIGVDVSVGDPLARVSTTGEIPPAIDSVIGSLAVPIGLAIDDMSMRTVDLLPKDVAKSKSTRSHRLAVLAPVAVAVPLVALGVMYLGANGKVTDKQTELDAVTAEIAALPKPPGPEIDTSVVGDEVVRATALAGVLGGRLAWDSVFRDMARVLPDNVWLTSLSASLPETSNLADSATSTAAATQPGEVAAAPTAVSIDGIPIPSRTLHTSSRGSRPSRHSGASP